jgi:hypothetical protein
MDQSTSDLFPNEKYNSYGEPPSTTLPSMNTNIDELKFKYDHASRSKISTLNNIKSLSVVNNRNSKAYHQTQIQEKKLTNSIYKMEQRVLSLKRDEQTKLNIIANYHKKFDTMVETKKDRVVQLLAKQTIKAVKTKKLEKAYTSTQQLKVAWGVEKYVNDRQIHAENTENQLTNRRTKVTTQAQYTGLRKTIFSDKQLNRWKVR